jgi:hypothetical protein
MRRQRLLSGAILQSPHWKVPLQRPGRRRLQQSCHTPQVPLCWRRSRRQNGSHRSGLRGYGYALYRDIGITCRDGRTVYNGSSPWLLNAVGGRQYLGKLGGCIRRWVCCGTPMLRISVKGRKAEQGAPMGAGHGRPTAGRRLLGSKNNHGSCTKRWRHPTISRSQGHL